MLPTLLLALVFSGSDDNGGRAAAITDAERFRYEAAREKASGSAGSQVKLALWCEAHGLLKERAQHLSMAIALDPVNVLARAIQGQVAYRGGWDSADSVAQQIPNDPAERGRLADYVDRRNRTLDTPNSQQELAIWCDRNGLKDQALAHYNEVLRLDSGNEAVWRRLGYKKQGDQWVRPDSIAADRQEAERQRRAEKQWRSQARANSRWPR